jgi:Tfp pilus assembly protein FimT
MKQFRSISRFRSLTQKGFTLIELAIVGLFLGILAVFAITAFSGSATDVTKANGLFEASQKIGDNWALAAQSCSIPADVTATVVGSGTAPTTAGKNFSMLVGTAGVVGSYQTCVGTSGIRPLTGLTTGVAGSEAVQNFLVTLSTTVTAAGRPAMAIKYAAVPESIILPLYNKYSSGAGASTMAATAFSALTSDSTDNTVQFGALASGKRDLTIVRPL